MSQIALAQKDPSQILRVTSGIKAQHRALGLDKHVDEAELPRLLIDVFSHQEIAEIRAGQGDEDLTGAELINPADEPTSSPTEPDRNAAEDVDDDVIVLGGDDDDQEEDESVPAAVPIVRTDEQGCRFVRGAS